MAGALPGVAALHAAGLLHADLKPDHLLATGSGRVVVVDLGSVRRADDRTSAVWGTDGYLAPEIAPGADGPSTASDVWSLGRTLGVLAAGPAGPGRPPRVPANPDVARLVAACTDPAPARRPSLPALADALADLRDREDAAAAEPTAGPTGGTTRTGVSASGTPMDHDGPGGGRGGRPRSAVRASLHPRGAQQT